MFSSILRLFGDNVLEIKALLAGRLTRFDNWKKDDQTAKKKRHLKASISDMGIKSWQKVFDRFEKEVNSDHHHH